MVVILTICSANYLAQAKTLGDSLREHNPAYRFVIGLVDRLPPGLMPSSWHPYELLPVEALGIPQFEEMRRRYNLVELNTAVKPFYMQHLYERDAGLQSVVYLDPDILILSDLSSLAESLQRHSIILTPHCCTYDEADQHYGYELAMLATGIYNCGFVGTSRCSETSAFLRWWARRLAEHCYYLPKQGLFVDQLWTILAPIFFDRVHIEKDPGYNVCYWNLPQRAVSLQQGRYWVNQTHRLLFYHFSSYNPLRPEFLSTRPPPVALSSHPELASLAREYGERLLRNQYAAFCQLDCHYYPRPLSPPPPTGRRAAKQHLKRIARTALQALPLGTQRLCRRLGQFLADNTPKNSSAPTSLS